MKSQLGFKIKQLQYSCLPWENNLQSSRSLSVYVSTCTLLFKSLESLFDCSKGCIKLINNYGKIISKATVSISISARLFSDIISSQIIKIS